MSTTDMFEQRALAAGASLQAAFFFDGGTMTTTTTYRAPSMEQDEGPRRRSRSLVAAAAAATAFAVGAAVVVTTDADQQALPPAEQSPGAAVTGLPGAPDYPLELPVPSTLRPTEEDAGTRGFALASGADGGLILSGLRSVAGVDVADLPADVTQAFASRKDMVVTDRDVRRVDGRRAQAFTLAAAPGQRPTDLWCAVAGGSCYKVVPDKAMEVLVVETGAAPLWIAAEYTSDARDEVRAALAEVLERLKLPSTQALSVAGVSLSLPAGWQVDARGPRYAQAGDPAQRDAEGVNVVVPASVVALDGSRSATPDDLAGWLAAQEELEVQRLQVVQVGGRDGVIVRVDPTRGARTLWCGAPATDPDTSSCFNTGTTAVLYLLVPFGDETLVLERSSLAPVDGLTAAEVQPWVDSHLELAATVRFD